MKIAIKESAFIYNRKDGHVGTLVSGNIDYEIQFWPRWEMENMVGCTMAICKSKRRKPFAYSVSEREYLDMMGWDIVSPDMASKEMEL